MVWLFVPENMLINKYSYPNGELTPKLQRNVNKNEWAREESHSLVNTSKIGE